MAAACNAFVQLLGIARHGSGMTRINVGQLVAGEGRNVIPSHAVMKMEVRGETGEINQYMYDSAVNIIKGCALSQNCEYTIEKMGEAVDLTQRPRTRQGSHGSRRQRRRHDRPSGSDELRRL